MAKAEFVLGNKIIDELIKQGIADQDTQRVIIDIPVDGFPIIYIQKIGTKAVIDLVTLLGGIDLDKIMTHATKITSMPETGKGGSEENPDRGHWPAQGYDVVIPDEQPIAGSMSMFTDDWTANTKQSDEH